MRQLTLKGVLTRRYSWSDSVGSTLCGTSNLTPLTARAMGMALDVANVAHRLG